MRQSSNRHTVVYRSWSASQERAVLRQPELLHAAPSIVPTSFGMLLMRLDVAKTRRESGVARTDGLKRHGQRKVRSQRLAPSADGRRLGGLQLFRDGPRRRIHVTKTHRDLLCAGCPPRDRRPQRDAIARRRLLSLLCVPTPQRSKSAIVFTRSGVFHRCRLRVAPLQRRRTTLSQDETA